MLMHALAPPTPGGTPIVLARLLERLPGFRLEVVTDRRLRRRVRSGANGTLAGRYRFVWKWPGWGGRWRAGRVAGLAIDLVLSAVAGVRAARWARRDDVRWIVSVTDEGFSPIAGAIAARLARLPHVVMVFDLWEENAYSDVHRALARRLERPIFRAAARIIGFCEETAEHYRAKHGIEVAVLRTPVDVRSAPAARRSPSASGGDNRELLLTGAVYWAQYDAVARLLRVRDRIPGLEVVALGNRAMLDMHGLEADRYEDVLHGAAFRERLARADVLFLGLSLRSDHPAVIETATPARLVELMCSGRPFLVHAPPGSHVAEYARRERFATVVDEADDGALEAGLRALLADKTDGAKAVARGWRIAAERHNSDSVRDAFARLLRDTSRPMRERPTP